MAWCSTFGVRVPVAQPSLELPIDGVKLDLAFLRGPSHSDDASLLTAVMAVARGLKLRVFAQGVDAAQLELLGRLGFAEVQGFHLGPPVPPATLADQLSQRGPKLEAGGPMSFGGRLETLDLSGAAAGRWRSAPRAGGSRSRGSTATRCWCCATGACCTWPAERSSRRWPAG